MLLLSSIYKPEKENKNILVLHSEKKYTYADGLTKENTIVWKNNKEFGYTFVEKYFNKKNEPLKNTLKAYKKGEHLPFIKKIIMHNFNSKTSPFYKKYKLPMSMLELIEEVTKEDYEQDN